MGAYLNPGNDAFAISVNDDIFVDKSGLISYINSKIGKRKRFICVSRPRSFGKSMAAEMLVAYYDKSCDSHGLFQGLEVAREESYQENLNQYDVIFLNVQQFLSLAGSADKVVESLKQKVLAELRDYYHDVVPPWETELSCALAAVYAQSTGPNKGFLFVIDEWDCIFREEKDNVDAQKAYLDFLRDLFKDRTYVKAVYMTGILPIKKYGTHTALNIFDEFSMAAPGKLAKYIGFTEQEVRQLCKSHGMRFTEAKRWYDGYHLKQMPHIYNPKSVADAMMEGDFRSYWTGTETYEALQVYVDLEMDGLGQAWVSLLAGSGIPVDVGSFQNDMTSFKSREDVLTLLVHLGYLAYEENARSVFIPNEEIRGEFIRALKNGRRAQFARAICQSGQILEATVRMDEKEVARLAEEVQGVGMAASPLFPNPDPFFPDALILAYLCNREGYPIARELPAGEGYGGVLLLPRKNSQDPAVFLEVAKEVSAKEAVSKMGENNWPPIMAGFEGDILLAAIRYDRKKKSCECAIEKREGIL